MSRIRMPGSRRHLATRAIAVSAFVLILAGCSRPTHPASSTPAPKNSPTPSSDAASEDSAPTGTTIRRIWSLEGFKAPESVLFDADRDVLYVSNINGTPTTRNGLGFLSRVSLDGKILDLEWVTGLNAPKGMARVGNRLFVADIDVLVEVDIDRGVVSKRHNAAGARFLNDTTADSNGIVYVSDMLGDAIYRLEDEKLTLWLQDKSLESPNGLLAEEDRLVVACWGAMTHGWTTEVPGHLKVVSFQDKQIATMGSGAVVGNLDGLEPDGNGNYLATDFTLGRLFRIHPDGTFETLLRLRPGSADIERIAARKWLLIPLMNDGRVDAYQLP